MIGLRRALWALAAAGLIGVAVTTELVARADFAPDRGLWIVLNIVLGGGFVGVGLFAWYRRPENRVGTLMVATGFAWFVGMLGRTDPPLLFTTGVLLGNLFVAFAIHLLLAFPTGVLPGRSDRWLVTSAYVITTVGFVPFILTADPVAGGCTGCPENVFLLTSEPSFAATWTDILNVCGIGVMGWALVRIVARWRGASPPSRRVIAPILLAGASLSVLLAVALVGDLVEIPHQTLDIAFYSALIPLGLVPYLFLASLVQARMFRGGAVGGLVTRLSGALAPGELRDALARAFGDPSLDLAYWLPDSERYVDVEGHTVELSASDDRATSHVLLAGRRVATMVHDPLLLDEPELIDAVTAAAAMSLEKERLRAELAAKVEELREQRARIIAVGLSERQRLERDLHVGAQQRLVSLALDLRLARSSLREDPQSAERLLDAVDEELGRALEELRELARGLHPAVLADRGLDPAIDALASRSPVPVEIEARLGQRVPGEVELAAYFVVAESLTNVVKYAEASHATVRVGRDNGRVLVEVADDGVGGADPRRGTGLRGLADRLAALGGDLEVDSSPGAGTTVIARIPCE